jgi:hypothetical protein
MTRANLKELIDRIRPSRITADMYADPLMRSMERSRERAGKRYREDLLALYADRALTDDQRWRGLRKAQERRDAVLKKLDERFEVEVEIPMLLKAGVLRSGPAKPGKRRA